MQKNELADQSLVEIAHAIRTRSTSARAVMEAALARAHEVHQRVSCFSELFDAEALAEADACDRSLATRAEAGPLFGVPIGIKDLYDLAGKVTTAGTVALGTRPAAQADATLVARLRAAGAIVVGRLKMSEGAFAAHHPDLGTPGNPWGADLWVGASSSGNAAATAAGACYASMGSDTGGSIRFPCAATGLTGLKPTWGRLSRSGMVEFSGSLDCPGPMARSAEDCALLYDILAGSDPKDPVTLGRQYQRAVPLLADRPIRPKIGVDPALVEQCDPATRDAIANALRQWTALGAEVVDVTLPDLSVMVPDWLPACAVECAGVYEEIWRRQPVLFGDQLGALIEQGLGLPATAYRAILQRRTAFAGRMRAVFNQVDALLLHVTAKSALQQRQLDALGVGPGWESQIMLTTCPINMAGLPAITFTAGMTEQQTPVGIQLVGGEDQEAFLLRMIHAFQQSTSYHLQRPPR